MVQKLHCSWMQMMPQGMAAAAAAAASRSQGLPGGASPVGGPAGGWRPPLRLDAPVSL
jgi:hypothetical protein